MDAAGNVSTVFSFGPYSADGWRPTTNPIEGRDGYLYGTTPRGGTSPSGSYGVVYRLSKTGSLTVLHWFSARTGSSRGPASSRRATACSTARRSMRAVTYRLGTLLRESSTRVSPRRRRRRSSPG